ncbi:MAG TPA: hypothetical protein VED40_15000 [Azospirillaceae bacterium]|nr:hypothetical protein [Azospirillaceae bacterium]
MAKPRSTPPVSVSQRVEAALSMGGLRQWLLLEDAAQIAEAKLLLKAAKAKHVEPVTLAEMERLQETARAGIAARAFSRPALTVVETPAAEEPARKRRKAA